MTPRNAQASKDLRWLSYTNLRANHLKLRGSNIRAWRIFMWITCIIIRDLGFQRPFITVIINQRSLRVSKNIIRQAMEVQASEEWPEKELQWIIGLSFRGWLFFFRSLSIGKFKALRASQLQTQVQLTRLATEPGKWSNSPWFRQWRQGWKGGRGKERFKLEQLDWHSTCYKKTAARLLDKKKKKKLWPTLEGLYSPREKKHRDILE